MLTQQTLVEYFQWASRELIKNAQEHGIENATKLAVPDQYNSLQLKESTSMYLFHKLFSKTILLDHFKIQHKGVLQCIYNDYLKGTWQTTTEIEGKKLRIAIDWNESIEKLYNLGISLSQTDLSDLAKNFIRTKNSGRLQKLLEDHKEFDLDFKNPEGLTILDFAIEQKNVDAVQLLLNHGAVNNIGNNGLSSLDLAINKRSEDIVRLLTNAGSDINRIRPDGITSLERALNIGDETVIHTLATYTHFPIQEKLQERIREELLGDLPISKNLKTFHDIAIGIGKDLLQQEVSMPKRKANDILIPENQKRKTPQTRT